MTLTEFLALFDQELVKMQCTPGTLKRYRRTCCGLKEYAEQANVNEFSEAFSCFDFALETCFD